MTNRGCARTLIERPLAFGSKVARIDPVRLTKVMTVLLEPHSNRSANLDRDGWVRLEVLVGAASEIMSVRIEVDHVVAALRRGPRGRFELRGERVRIARKWKPRAPRVPDILYHATHREQAEQARRTGVLAHGANRPVFLSATEDQAWRAAHRSGAQDPVVLYVDAGRARRRGVRFNLHRKGQLFAAPRIPVQHVLNLQPNFGHQLSAGGFPIALGADGKVRVALISVTRRSGITWEVAKGKMEPGEVPERTAVREVMEEMGVSCTLRVVHSLGMVRYGFLAPGGLPRLKTIYLYLMTPNGPMESFIPSEREGIGDVAWFDLETASRLITHTSLIPQMLKVRRMLSDPDRVARILRDDAPRSG